MQSLSEMLKEIGKLIGDRAMLPLKLVAVSAILLPEQWAEPYAELLAEIKRCRIDVRRKSRPLPCVLSVLHRAAGLTPGRTCRPFRGRRP